jgi:hypothetical protein
MVKVSNPVLLTSTFQAGWEACLFVEIGGARQVSDGRIDAAPEILKNHGEITTAARPAKDWMWSTWLVVDARRGNGGRTAMCEMVGSLGNPGWPGWPWQAAAFVLQAV